MLRGRRHRGGFPKFRQVAAPSGKSRAHQRCGMSSGLFGFAPTGNPFEQEKPENAEGICRQAVCHFAGCSGLTPRTFCGRLAAPFNTIPRFSRPLTTSWVSARSALQSPTPRPDAW